MTRVSQPLPRCRRWIQDPSSCQSFPQYTQSPLVGHHKCRCQFSPLNPSESRWAKAFTRLIDIRKSLRPAITLGTTSDRYARHVVVSLIIHFVFPYTSSK